MNRRGGRSQPTAEHRDDTALRRARRFLADVALIDGHNDLAWTIRHHEKAPGDVEAYDLRARTPGDTDLSRLRAGGVGGQFWSVYVPGDAKADGYARLQLEQIDIARRVIARYPERLQPCLGVRDVGDALARRRIASLLGMEGGHALENSLGALRSYYDLGVRYMTLTHNVSHDWADAALDTPRHGGLTRFGEEVVREMNRLGMLVDLAHVSPAVMEHALAVSEAPVIFSHSSCRALTDHPRNVPDGVLEKLAANRGIVMITFVGPFVSTEVARAYEAALAVIKPRTEGIEDRAERYRLEREYFAGHPLPRATIGQVADHVEHARRVAGADHIGIGGDYDGNEHWPVGLEDVASYPSLFAELIRRGWRDRELAKLARGNILRVLGAAEATARRLRKRRPPSTATRDQLDHAPA
jgi:membrane dipeptidase